MKASPPDAASFHSRKQIVAFTFIEVLVIIVAIAILASLMIQALSHPDHDAMRSRVKCVSNLKQLGIAYLLWAGDNGDKYPMAVSTTNGGSLELIANGDVIQNYRVMSNELNDPKIVVCPNDMERNAATNFDLRNENLSFFVGMDASQMTSQALLSGDRNITDGTPMRNHMLELTTNHPASWTEKIHHGQGNVGLADGSVQQFSSSSLRKQISLTGLATNRLVMP